MSFSKKLFILIIGIGVIPTFYTLIRSYITIRNALKNEISSNLDAIAQRQENRLDNRLSQRKEKFSLISSKTLLKRNLKEYLGGKTDQRENIIASISEIKSTLESTKNISIADLKGNVLFSTDESLVGKNWEAENYFNTGKSQVSVDIIRENQDGSVSAYLSGPLSLDDEIIGVLVLETNNDSLNSFILDYSGFGATGEIIIVQKSKSGDAAALTPLRFDDKAAFNKVWLQKENSPPILALAKQENIYLGWQDYRGVFTVAATRYIDSVGWGMVVKFDDAELFAPLKRIRNEFLGQALIILVFAMAAAGYFAKTITDPIKKLKLAAEKFASGDLDVNVEISSNDEIGELAKTFKHMATEIEISFNILKEKVEELKQTQKEKDDFMLDNEEFKLKNRKSKKAL